MDPRRNGLPQRELIPGILAVIVVLTTPLLVVGLVVVMLFSTEQRLQIVLPPLLKIAAMLLSLEAAVVGFYFHRSILRSLAQALNLLTRLLKLLSGGTGTSQKPVPISNLHKRRANHKSTEAGSTSEMATPKTKNDLVHG